MTVRPMFRDQGWFPRETERRLRHQLLFPPLVLKLYSKAISSPAAMSRRATIWSPSLATLIFTAIL